MTNLFANFFVTWNKIINLGLGRKPNFIVINPAILKRIIFNGLPVWIIIKPAVMTIHSKAHPTKALIFRVSPLLGLMLFAPAALDLIKQTRRMYFVTKPFARSHDLVIETAALKLIKQTRKIYFVPNIFTQPGDLVIESIQKNSTPNLYKRSAKPSDKR